MLKTNSNQITEIEVTQERSHFLHMLAKNPNYFGNIPGSKLKPIYQLAGDTTYEQINCVGYNPDTANMEATISIKLSSGYNGDLCTAGSLEYLRFYLDFNDGNGFIDQGITAINVHDIPAADDCNGNSVFPLIYVATMAKATPTGPCCEFPLLPTLRAILSWSSAPPANAPDWQPVWGNVVNGAVQIKPRVFCFIDPLPVNFANNLSTYLELAITSPDLSSSQLTDISGVDINQLVPKPVNSSLANLANTYSALNVPASRFALKTVAGIIQNPLSEISIMDNLALTSLNIDVNSIIDGLAKAKPANATEANVEWEQLDCIGLDYNIESLVATINIKQNAGFNGGLCTAGSKEYVAFWIDWNNDCKWQYLDTLQLNVHDINITGNGLYYTVTLPLNADSYRKLCTTPNIVRVRGVLSWEIAPSTTNPNQLEQYGNRVDAHIQIVPGIAITGVQPIFTTIGGIAVGSTITNVDKTTGLTIIDSNNNLPRIVANGLQVPTGCPFGGDVAIWGPSFPGYHYRITVTNLGTNQSNPLNNKFTGEVWTSPVTFFNQVPDANSYYAYPPQNLPTLLANFTPGTNDKLLITLDLLEIPNAVFSQIIQMNNSAPTIQLVINDSGNCDFYSIGMAIEGTYSAYSQYMNQWSFGSTWGGGANGSSNTPGAVAFSIPTVGSASPCGNVVLSAWDLTIVDSSTNGGPNNVGWLSEQDPAICLQPGQS